MRCWRQLALEQLDEQDGEAEQSNGKINGSPFNKGDGGIHDSTVRTFVVFLVGGGFALCIHGVPFTTPAAAVFALKVFMPNLLLNIHVYLQSCSVSMAKLHGSSPYRHVPTTALCSACSCAPWEALGLAFQSSFSVKLP